MFSLIHFLFFLIFFSASIVVRLEKYGNMAAFRAIIATSVGKHRPDAPNVGPSINIPTIAHRI